MKQYRKEISLFPYIPPCVNMIPKYGTLSCSILDLVITHLGQEQTTMETPKQWPLLFA